MGDSTGDDGVAGMDFSIDDGDNELAAAASLLDLASEVASSQKRETSSGSICKICGKNPAMKAQIFCLAPCGGDVRGA